MLPLADFSVAAAHLMLAAVHLEINTRLCVIDIKLVLKKNIEMRSTSIKQVKSFHGVVENIIIEAS